MKTRIIAVIVIGVIISTGAGFFYDQTYDCLFPPMWMKIPRSYSLGDCLQMYADGTLPNYTNARADHAEKQARNMELIERYKDEPVVEAFYAKYDDANVSGGNDFVSYSAGNNDDFRIRMNLYYDESYELTHLRLYCYIGGEFQSEIAQEDILNYLKNYHCLTYNTGEKFTVTSTTENIVTITKVPDESDIEENVDYIPLICPDGQIEKDGECITNPNCKPPFFVTINGVCVTDKSSPECYPDFPSDHCRVPVECDVPFESGKPIPQCTPLTDCPKGFLFSIFPVDGNDAICERIERNIGFVIFSAYDNKVLRGDGTSFPLGGESYDGAVDEDQLVDALDIAATRPDETRENLRVLILVNGWYEQLGNPNVTLINPRGVDMENQFIISMKDEPGLTTFVYDTTIGPNAETGIWKVHVSLTDFDDPSIQSFQVINSNDMTDGE